ncbi:hypothetical protein I551_6122 [Mycobacterium ulcerans str. Harvey]|uniref:Uncharacterized protein n=1 Tax=Mycobacterium ulcerans str. Harvey TaxID=1299332 RepID=A0ABN0QS21_MYCUL|nr:hypothetical protein I551_6122 [Mycobacterium ulcerans str. Harvey]
MHHGANNPYLNKNYGGILIVWDRLFGSYAEEDEPVQYGLQQNIATHNPIKLNYHEFAAMLSDVGRAKTWRGRVGYLLRPPGWSEVAETPAPAHMTAMITRFPSMASTGRRQATASCCGAGRRHWRRRSPHRRGDY